MFGKPGAGGTRGILVGRPLILVLTFAFTITAFAFFNLFGEEEKSLRSHVINVIIAFCETLYVLRTCIEN
jgi:hypothetical protein